MNYLRRLNITVHSATNTQIDLEGPIHDLCMVVSRCMDQPPKLVSTHYQYFHLPLLFSEVEQNVKIKRRRVCHRRPAFHASILHQFLHRPSTLIKQCRVISDTPQYLLLSSFYSDFIRERVHSYISIKQYKQTTLNYTTRSATIIVTHERPWTSIYCQDFRPLHSVPVLACTVFSLSYRQGLILLGFAHLLLLIG